MATIEISRVSKIFKDPKRKADVIALDDINLSVAKNEFLCLLGPSGCGKSTLLKNPQVILMDEPFGALDEQTRMDMQNELVRIWQEHRGTIVFVTHGIDE